jgi:tetratricopeptide (TPR) repeat protein
MNYQSLAKKSLINNRKPLLLATLGLMFATQGSAEAAPAEQTIPMLLLRAQSALASGQAQQAAEWYEKAAAMGESAEAEIGLVRAYLQSGEFRKAIAFGNLVAAEHPDVSETAALLAYLEDREGQTTPALAKLSEELKKRPDDVALFAAQQEILIDRMAIPQAIKQLDDWIGRNPPQSDIYRLRARAALAAGNREELIIWRKKTALAYEANGDMEAAKPLRDWLSKVDGNQQSPSTTSAPLALERSATEHSESPKVSRWPAHILESFPLNSKNIVKSGNGFIVDQGRSVITYASLVAEANNEVWVRNGLGKIRKSRVEQILPDQGLALLRLETPYAEHWSLPDQAFAVPDGVHFCFVMGFPLTDPLETGYPVIAPGVVVRPDAGINSLMQITGSLGPENSGSAVFDSSGKFIGMTLGKQEPLKGITDRDAMLGKGTFAVRADALQKLLTKPLRSGKKTTKTKTIKGAPSVEDLYEKLQPTVVTIVVTD